MIKHLIKDNMPYPKILNIDPKGNITYLDKNGMLKFDLNSYQLTDEKQIKAFGKVILVKVEMEKAIK